MKKNVIQFRQLIDDKGHHKSACPRKTKPSDGMIQSTPKLNEAQAGLNTAAIDRDKNLEIKE